MILGMRVLIAGAVVLAIVMEILKALLFIIPMLIVGYVVVRLTDDWVDDSRAGRAAVANRHAGGIGGRRRR